MESPIQDLRHGIRMFWKTPGFTAVGVITLALGIGANTAIFSVLNAVMLRPLPYSDPGRLIRLFATDSKQGVIDRAISAPDFADWKRENTALENLAAVRERDFSIADRNIPELVHGAVTTGSLFPLLGINPLIGRSLLPTDDGSGPRVAVLSERLWKRRFGADPSIVGRSLEVNGDSVIVAGVMPAEFALPVNADIWVSCRWTVPEFPLKPDVNPAELRGASYLDVYARLRPGVTLRQAQVQMETIAYRLEQRYPDTNFDTGVRAVSLQESLFGKTQHTVLVLLGAVIVVLLIASFNVANLQVTRALQRRVEFAVRASLGATKIRLMQQMLTESFVLAIFGGGLGVILASWATPILARLSPASLNNATVTTMGGVVLLFTVVVSIVSGIIFGVAPVLLVSRMDLNEVLKEGGAGGSGATIQPKARTMLIIGEVALSFALLVGAGLMFRSFIRLTDVSLGFDPENLFTCNISLAPAIYPDDTQQSRFFTQVLERIASLPGVEGVAATNRLPMAGGNSSVGANIPGRPAREAVATDYRAVSMNYFRTLRIPVLSGRDFTSHDNQTATQVAIVNETLARILWPHDNPLGQRLVVRKKELQVVGVVGLVKHVSLDEASRPEMYTPYLQDAWPTMDLAIRTTSDTSSITASVRRAVMSIEKNQAVSKISSMQDLIANSASRQRFVMTLLAIFAGLALVLSLVGMYGVISYSIAQRTRELGVRIALGARPSEIFKLVLWEGFRLSVAGVLAGIFIALTLTRALKAFLYGIRPSDPMTFVATALILILTIIIATYFPARRAARVDPLASLRYQ